MAKIDLLIPSLENKFVDLRDSISGDAYNFSWTRPLSEVNYLAIHHSASEDQTPEEIAKFHIQNNGWGGIGYHFLIAKDGTVFYVGDISTARANVANLNEQVLGICLIGNFVDGVNPSVDQLDSTHKLCEFFINEYSEIPNINSWDKVRGHKDLLGQSTNCPGDDWESWRIQIVEGVNVEGVPANGQNIEDIEMLQSQVNNLQSSLASVNQQLIFLQETLQQRDQEINELKSISNPVFNENITDVKAYDTTLTIVGALINLYKFLIPPRKSIPDFVGSE